MLESWRLVWRRCARLFVAAAAVMYSTLAPALGLGDITLHSALNQPLQADIALLDAEALADGELSVSLASADAFGRAGVERVLFLDDLKFTPILRGNRRLIRVTSHKPVNEPFLNFLVQLNQPNGQLLREYTVLIDPPGSPGIVPASDEALADSQGSAFPLVQPAVAPPVVSKGSQPAPSVDSVLAERLAASERHNQQLQATLDELNTKLQAQEEQMASQQQLLSELQARTPLPEQTSTQPIAPVAVAPTPVAVEQSDTGMSLTVGGPMLVALLLLWWFVRRQRRQVPESVEPSAVQPLPHEPLFDRAPEPLQPLQTPQNTWEPKPGLAAPSAVANSVTVPSDGFELVLDDLPMNARISPRVVSLIASKSQKAGDP